MDESVLLDLLECPVCLERLDATAKVLPCQHTFCRRCLQGILSSRSELRCPECRTLVDCGVDELPTNILLVRLLDGIKHRPRRSGNSGVNGNNNVNGTTRVQSNGVVSANCSIALRDLQGTHRVQARSPPVRVSQTYISPQGSLNLTIGVHHVPLVKQKCCLLQI